MDSCLFSVLSAIFLGGVLDSLQEMFYGKPKTEESEEKKNGEINLSGDQIGNITNLS